MSSAPEKATLDFYLFTLIFIVPLVITAIIWIIGRISDKIYLLTTGWFGVLFSAVLTAYLFIYVIVIGVFQPVGVPLTSDDPKILAVSLGYVVLPFLIPGILVWLLLKKYSLDSQKGVKNDFVYILGYLYMGIIFTIQFYAFSRVVVL